MAVMMRLATLLLLAFCQFHLYEGSLGVQKVIIPGGSRLAKAIVLNGFQTHLIPRLKNSANGYKAYADKIKAYLAQDKQELNALGNRTVLLFRRLKAAVNNLVLHQKECVTTLKNTCPRCVKSECESRMKSECQKPLAVLELLAKKLNPCNLFGPLCKVPIINQLGDIFDWAIEGSIDVLKGAGKLLKDIVSGKLLKDVGKSVGDLLTKTIPDLLINQVPKFFKDAIFKGVGRTLKNLGTALTKDLSKAVEDLAQSIGDLASDVGSELEEFVVDVADDIGGLLEDVGKSVTDIAEDVGDVTADIAKDLGKAVKDVSKTVGNAVGSVAKGISSALKSIGSVAKKIFTNPIRSISSWFGKRRKRSADEPSCRELQKNPENACTSYLTHPKCASRCNPENACPDLAPLFDDVEALNNTFLGVHKAYVSLNQSYYDKVQGAKARLAERLRGICWVNTIIKHYQSDPIRPWFNVTKIITYENILVDPVEFTNVTVAVDMGSDDHRYQGKIVFAQGFNPLSSLGIKKIAEEALVWYKSKLVQNNACSS
eukprot:m.1837 g.1837  ORF g.1837 m.1837 type:complete len:542 (+) comp7946_c0_seq1:289-1914(+)